MSNTVETYVVEYGQYSATCGDALAESGESDGCGNVNWNVKVPMYWNDVRYYRDVRAHVGLTLTFISTCATCNGEGRVPYVVDAGRKRFPRMRSCPEHVATRRVPGSIYAIPPMIGQRCDYA